MKNEGWEKEGMANPWFAHKWQGLGSRVLQEWAVWRMPENLLSWPQLLPAQSDTGVSSLLTAKTSTRHEHPWCTSLDILKKEQQSW